MTVIMLHAVKCGNPIALVNNNVRVMGYEDPALEGESIILTCPSGSLLSGPNSSICMGNGEWEPDPREVVCIRELMTTGTTITSMSLKFTLSMYSQK